MRNNILILCSLSLALSLVTIDAAVGDSGQNSPLRPGMLLPLTGPAATVGEDLRGGAEICSSPDLPIVFEDSQSNPAAGVGAFSKLLDHDKVNFAVVALSPVASAVVPIAARRNIPVLLSVVSATAVSHSSGGEVVRFFTSAEQEAPLMAEAAANKLHLNRVSVLHMEDDYGISYRDAFVAAFQRSGGVVPRTESFRRETVDFRTELLRLKAARVQAIYFVGYDVHYLNLLKQVAELNLGIQILGNWTLSHPNIVALKPELRENVAFTTPEFYFSERPEVLKFKAAYRAQFGRDASGYAGLGCDIAHLLGQSPTKTPRGAIEYLKAVTNVLGVMGRLSADPKGEITMDLHPVVYRGGKLRRLER